MKLLHTKSLTVPESVGFEGRIGVDVVVQPPLHGHVPVTHAMSDLHTEVCVVAVNVLDGFEVVFLFSDGIRAGNKGENVEKEKTKRHKH